MTVHFCRDFSLTETGEKFVLPRGVYLFECWGAQGNVNGYNVGGKGAYTKGTIYLRFPTTFYAYVGQYGTTSASSGVFNGGGDGQFTGGSATDFRLVGGSWDNFESSKSRIKFAAGSGGPDSGYQGGAGGVLAGFSSSAGYGKVCEQTKGGNGCASVSFGKGGGSGTANGGSGGSSFVSGYDGCLAILNKSTSSLITHKTDSNHYSGFVFCDPVIINGNSSMPTTSDSNVNETGHANNGYARVTILKSINLNEGSCKITSIGHAKK